MRALVWIAMAIAMACVLAACARHVVIDPSDVASHNDPEWEVAREPGRPSPPPPAAPEVRSRAE